jgi:hypothetical protein
MFDIDQDPFREKQAVELYLKRTTNSYKKLSPTDVDFRILSESKSLIGYVEVKVLNSVMSNSFPLTVEARKIIKLRDKRLNAVMIWSCLDGILYLPIDNLYGDTDWDENTGELIICYKNKKPFKYVRA